jgi:dihydroorotate dehydrogenase/Pyruvate/2-oxoacid:ferredoxin oxidoreductase delta subunit
MANLRTSLFGLEMPGPFILASGPLSYDATGLWEAYRAGAGGVVTKTLRLEAAINPTPHMVVPRSPNLRATLFNSEKWADLPWEQWVERELPAMAGHPGLLIASIGHTPAEGEAIAGPVAETGVVDAIECVAYTQATIVDLVRRVHEQAPKTPILAKLTFNWGDDLYMVAEEVLKAGANGFTAIDSIGPTLQIDIETGEPTIGGAGNKAWMSGAAIRPMAQAIVSELAVRYPGVPVVGTGGIIQAEDAVEMTMVGASALGVCTGPLLRGLEWFERTSEKLSAWLDGHAYPDLAAIRGKVLPRLHAAEVTSWLTFAFDPLKCTKCDLCVVLCPYDARQMGGGDRPKSATLTQILDEDRCRYCGLCVEVCKPGSLTYGNWPR